MTTSPHDPNVPLTFTPNQPQVAAVENGEAKPFTFNLGTASWPLVAKVSYLKVASMQHALKEFDMLAFAEHVSALVEPGHRESLKAFILADREADDPDFVEINDVIDAFSDAQEKMAARPSAK